MIEVVTALLAYMIGYWIGRSEGYSEGRRDGWMQYDSIVPDIRDECEQLKRGGKR